jgi:hypothetical protein
MTTSQDVLTVARRQVGIKENPPGSNRSKFGSWYGLDANPWCAMFVSYCFHQAGMPLAIQTKKGFAYCPSGVEWFKKANRWSTSNPQPGDVVFYCWRGDGIADHVGIVDRVVSSSEIISIEGNTSPVNDTNGGEVMSRSRTSAVILGYGKPDYNQVSTGNPNVDTSWQGVYLSLTSPLMESEDIRTWQKWMVQIGYSLEIDGCYGEKSEAACRDLQRKNQLEEDGVVGGDTWNKTCELAKKAPVPSPTTSQQPAAAAAPATSLQNAIHGTFTCTRNTVAKKRPVPSDQLADNEKLICAAGRIVPYISLQQAEGNHILVEMDFGAGKWYFFKPHTDTEGDHDAEISMTGEKWSIDQFVDNLIATAKKYGLPLKTQWAYMIATAQWETAGTFQPVREAYWLSEGWRKANLRYYPYYGRGFVQLTWAANYKKYADILNLPLLEQPDLVMKPKTALFILVHGFKGGVFTDGAHKLEDYIDASKTDYYNARRCINYIDKAAEIANIAQKWHDKL